RVGRFEFQAGQAVRRRARARAAVTLQVHAEQAELAELGNQVPREMPALEPAPDVRPYAVGQQFAHRPLDRPLLLPQQGRDVQQVQRVGHRTRCGVRFRRGLLRGVGHTAISITRPPEIGYPFTAPVRPPTMRRSAIARNASAGTMDRPVNARIFAVSWVYWVWKFATPSGRVKLFWSLNASSGSR